MSERTCPECGGASIVYQWTITLSEEEKATLIESAKRRRQDKLYYPDGTFSLHNIIHFLIANEQHRIDKAKADAAKHKARVDAWWQKQQMKADTEPLPNWDDLPCSGDDMQPSLGDAVTQAEAIISRAWQKEE